MSTDEAPHTTTADTAAASPRPEWRASTAVGEAGTGAL
jgi:hypothetical protein